MLFFFFFYWGVVLLLISLGFYCLWKGAVSYGSALKSLTLTKCFCCEYPAPLFARMLVVWIIFVLSLLCHCLGLRICEVGIIMLCFQGSSWVPLKEFRSWAQKWYLHWVETAGWNPSWVTSVFCLGWGEHSKTCRSGGVENTEVIHGLH